jgi:GWxTD domain-containing protein
VISQDHVRLGDITTTIRIFAYQSQGKGDFMRVLTATFLYCLLAVASSSAGADTTGQSNNPSHSLPAIYQHWLDEDVRWIITPEELTQFTLLSGNEDRDSFIVQFWLRRDPTPDSEVNEFKEEHYRRIAYSNVHFSARTTGSLTDRGRTYIFHGPPDSITKKLITSGVEAPTEIWHYEEFSPNGVVKSYEGKQPRKLNRVDLTFVDECKCGEYQLQTRESK